MAEPLSRVHRPCDECPWRKDCKPGRFAPERWEALRSTSIDPETHFGPEFGGPLFACHKTPEGGERTCAGWLAVEGINHPSIRFAALQGQVSACALEPGDGWPELHESFAEASSHDMSEEYDHE